MELHRKRELKGETFSVIHQPQTPQRGQVEQEHIALLKKRFRFGSLSPTS